MKIAVYGSRRQDAYLAEIEAFMRRLGELGHEVVMHPKLYKYLRAVMLPALGAVRRVTDSSDFTADVAVSIGGDGTFLRTAMWVGSKCLPIVGVNTGNLGYMTALGVDRLVELSEILQKGSMLTERRGLIEVVGPELPTWPFALNEVTVSKDESASMITTRATLNGNLLADYRADGLIVATATGSTAYNLSVGGPIIEPQTPVWVISPIAAHALTMRPLVVSDSSQLKLCPEARAEHFRLSVDGRSVSLPIGTEVSLRRAPFEVAVLHMPGQTFSETLRNKLHWGVD